MQILLVEDEISLSNAVKRILEQQGYFVDTAYDGYAAVEYACSTNYKLIILDIMLPGLDGFDVVRTLRREGVGTPILMLTARTSKHDKLAVLNCGADDYMTKPFDTDELLARVGALTRRTGGVIINKISFCHRCCREGEVIGRRMGCGHCLAAGKQSLCLLPLRCVRADKEAADLLCGICELHGFI